MKKQQSTRQKHTPQRTCVACRQKFDKKQLTRVVHGTGGIVIDETGKQNGRGAYLCNSPECWKRAHTGNILDQALRVSLTEADKAVLLTRQPDLP